MWRVRPAIEVSTLHFSLYFLLFTFVSCFFNWMYFHGDYRHRSLHFTYILYSCEEYGGWKENLKLYSCLFSSYLLQWRDHQSFHFWKEYGEWATSWKENLKLYALLLSVDIYSREETIKVYTFIFVNSMTLITVVC